MTHVEVLKQLGVREYYHETLLHNIKQFIEFMPKHQWSSAFGFYMNSVVRQMIPVHGWDIDEVLLCFFNTDMVTRIHESSGHLQLSDILTQLAEKTINPERIEQRFICHDNVIVDIDMVDFPRKCFYFPTTIDNAKDIIYYKDFKYSNEHKTFQLPLRYEHYVLFDDYHFAKLSCPGNAMIALKPPSHLRVCRLRKDVLFYQQLQKNKGMDEALVHRMMTYFQSIRPCFTTKWNSMLNIPCVSLNDLCCERKYFITGNIEKMNEFEIIKVVLISCLLR